MSSPLKIAAMFTSAYSLLKDRSQLELRTQVAREKHAQPTLMEPPVCGLMEPLKRPFLRLEQHLIIFFNKTTIKNMIRVITKKHSRSVCPPLKCVNGL